MKVCENKTFCLNNAFKYTKILEFDQYEKSYTTRFIIYADLEFLIENIDGCKNNPKNSLTTKVSKHITSGSSMPMISSFRSKTNKYDVYRGKKIAWKKLWILKTAWNEID